MSEVSAAERKRLRAAAGARIAELVSAAESQSSLAVDVIEVSRTDDDEVLAGIHTKTGDKSKPAPHLRWISDLNSQITEALREYESETTDRVLAVELKRARDGSLTVNLQQDMLSPHSDD